MEKVGKESSHTLLSMPCTRRIRNQEIMIYVSRWRKRQSFLVICRLEMYSSLKIEESFAFPMVFASRSDVELVLLSPLQQLVSETPEHLIRSHSLWPSFSRNCVLSFRPEYIRWYQMIRKMFAEDDTTHGFTRDAGNAVRLFKRTFPEFHDSLWNSSWPINPIFHQFLSTEHW
jgi:hypothetical protein